MGNTFRFRLQSVVRLRELDRDEAAEGLRQALQAKQILENQVSDIQIERSQQDELRLASKTGAINFQKMIDAQRYQVYLDSQKADLQRQISLIEQECERRRARLVKCEQAVRSLEKLELHQRTEWSSQQASKDQSTLDQWSSFRYWSNHQADDGSQALQPPDR
jgi:flagellar export protein FliJ